VASWRTLLQLTLVDAWQRRGPIAWLLAPLSVLHYLGYCGRRALYALGVFRPARLDVPVVVIGNLYVGGTGKTPLTVELARALAVRGWRPGIVSRGYGALASPPRLVAADDRARDVGDEPLLMARLTQVPVAVARSRVAASRVLRAQHPECDVLIADDGLQHWQLARDMEIALLHYRGLGNGWMLPAGPLREPRSRLDRVDAIVCNDLAPPIATPTPRYAMQSHLTVAFPLAAPHQREALTGLADAQRLRGWRLIAAAGIGMPDRFFGMLRAVGLQVDERPLADHFDFATNPFADVRADRILITEKDAVKCVANDELAADSRLWVVPLTSEVDPGLVDDVEQRLARISGRTTRGPSAA
jgi:tetraacyldisaccharide 4'-kinase